MEFDFRDIWTWALHIASLICLICVFWYLINRHRRKRLTPDEEGQTSRTAHSIGEAQWSLWKLLTFRWGQLFWAAPRAPESDVLDRRRRRRKRRRQHSEAAEARGKSDDESPAEDR